MKILQFHLLFAAIIVSLHGYSQAYVPIDSTSRVQVKDFISEFKARHQSKIALMDQKYSGEKRRKINSIYTEQFDDLSKNVQKGELYFDKDLNGYLRKILEEIQNANPQLKNEKFELYFSRDNSPNAYSVGDGTIVVHLKLLDILESEDELVSVLCHEIAHYILNHRDISINGYVERIASNDFKKQERKINKTKYNKQQDAEKLIQFVVYSRKSKSREHEYQADSLGYAFFKNTKYNLNGATSSLSKLSESDVEKDSLTNADLEHFFTTKSQKFIAEWLEMEDFSNYHYSKDHILKWNVDSLKTHPDCSNRLEKIKTMLTTTDNKGFAVDSAKFAQLKSIAGYESVYNYYIFKEYGYSLYEALKLLKVKENDPFLLQMVGYNLTKLAQAKKDMRFNAYIPAINPKDQTPSQQRFLGFMNNLSVAEIQRLANDYNETIK